MFAIETNKLTKYYGSARGIIDVDLAVEQGDFFGFIGPNGAGKSTLIRTVLGLISPSGGQVSVLGTDACNDKENVRAKIGYLPSETMFYHGMRVGELLAFSAKLRKADCKEEAKRLCDRLELDITRKIAELSFGNRKKVGIVCALQHKPSLYILDEPTSGLDPLMQKEFFEILQERNREGATVFLSSHVLSEVEQYCKHAAVIREGRLLACDSIAHLSHNGIKRVTLKGIRAFVPCDGMRDIVKNDDTVRFLYEGDKSALMRMLAELSFEDILIGDPTIDEIFLRFYKKDMED